MDVGRMLTRGIAAMSVSALPLVIGAQPASAFEAFSQQVSFDHSFTNSEGATITCTVTGGSALFREDSNDAFQATASTDTFNVEPSQEQIDCASSVSARMVYRELDGDENAAEAFGINSVTVRVDQVLGDFDTSHSVFFTNCVANCQVDFTSSPK